MCQEYITIALCAPTKVPSLSFTCGQLHMVAERRHVCDRARGTCPCFFGTCGIADKIANTMGIDISAVSKVRCAECTAREDNVGDRRNPQQIIDSPLLQRIAIDPDDEFVSRKHHAMLKELWGNVESCPFHVQTHMVNQHPVPAVDVEPNHSDERPSTPKVYAERVSKSPSMSHDTVDDGWTVPVAPSSAKDKSSRQSSASPTGIASVDLAVGLKSSRWAPKTSGEPVEHPVEKQPAPLEKRNPPAQAFNPDPNNASKVRDATKKMANVKAFLAGSRLL